MVRALQHNSINEFKRAYRSLDALLIDDIQFFANKDRSQEEFFHTFNALLEGQHQRHSHVRSLPEGSRLASKSASKSRFGWGLTVADRAAGDSRRCVAILMSKAHERRRRAARRSRVLHRRNAFARTFASSKARCAGSSRTRVSPAIRSRWTSRVKR